MPFGAEGVEPGVGLALSGGGFRATLFHCGAFCGLDELGFRERLDRVSSVSDGLITVGVLATRRAALRFAGAGANLRVTVVTRLRAFRVYGVADALPVLPERIGGLAALRTRLDNFSDVEQGRLINWGTP